MARPETRTRLGSMLLALLSREDRRNCWTLAGRAGEDRPWCVQHLLGRTVWDTDAVAAELRGFVVAHGTLTSDQDDHGLRWSWVLPDQQDWSLSRPPLTYWDRMTVPPATSGGFVQFLFAPVSVRAPAIQLLSWYSPLSCRTSPAI